MTPEANARDKFRKALLQSFPDSHYQRVEDKLASGIADIHIAIPSLGNWWVETKQLTRFPIKQATTVDFKFRPAQPIWLSGMNRVMGNCLVVVKISIPGQWFVFDHDFHLMHGRGYTYQTCLDQAKWQGSLLDIPAIFTKREIPKDSSSRESVHDLFGRE